MRVYVYGARSCCIEACVFMLTYYLLSSKGGGSVLLKEAQESASARARRVVAFLGFLKRERARRIRFRDPGNGGCK